MKRLSHLSFVIIFLPGILLLSCNQTSESDIPKEDRSQVELIEKTINDKQEILREETKKTKEAIDALLEDI